MDYEEEVIEWSDSNVRERQNAFHAAHQVCKGFTIVDSPRSTLQELNPTPIQ